MRHKTAVHIQGTVSPGFESLARLFEHQMQTLAEKNAQLCVYYRQEKVVDLWASSDGDSAFSADSLVDVFSSGKSLESIAIAWLESRGLLSYDGKIADYWPAFGVKGKHALTVADLMRHEAGLANFDTPLAMQDLFTDSIKRNEVGRVIERQTLSYRDPSNKREYHTITRGWIANELFRRVDPQGRTIGEFLRQEISEPLQADVVIGIQETDASRVAAVSPLSVAYQMLESLKPKVFGRTVLLNIFQLISRFMRIMPVVAKLRKSPPPEPFAGVQGIGFLNMPAFAKGETPSANAHCSARGLAKVAAMMASGGKWQGKEYISEQAWQKMHSNAKAASMGGLLSTCFTPAGVNRFQAVEQGASVLDRANNKGREGFFGWMGFGGSIFQWHPENEIGFAFVPTTLHVIDMFNERGALLQAEALKCVAGIADKDSAPSH